MKPWCLSYCGENFGKISCKKVAFQAVPGILFYHIDLWNGIVESARNIDTQLSTILPTMQAVSTISGPCISHDYYHSISIAQSLDITPVSA